ncbi:hypothetical protein Y032_0230g2965 [Ancylostoma ceylanicum]|nr:hypothetical protein Y032_0230g2965 [Ancylostoma ceylanicum]
MRKIGQSKAFKITYRTLFNHPPYVTVRSDGGDPSTAPTRTLRNRAVCAGIVVASRLSVISSRLSSRFGDLSTFSCFITGSSIMAGNDIDSGARRGCAACL